MANDTLGVLSVAEPAHRRRSVSGGDPASGSRPADLEVALLRRGLAGRSESAQRCGRCERTVLTGERIYEYASGAVRCELCRERERQAPAASHVVHGPAFGHSIRVIDRRGAR